MGEKNYTPKEYQDFISSFEGGVNGGVSPLIIEKNQLFSAVNISLRGGFASNRPPYFKLGLNFFGDDSLKNLFETGLFQGGGYYRPDYGQQILVGQFSGHLLTFTETDSGWNVADVSIAGDLNDSKVNQVWMWQAEKWLIVGDGTGTAPIIFDGASSRRAYQLVPTTPDPGLSDQPTYFGPVLGTTSADFTIPAIGSSATMTLSSGYTGLRQWSIFFNNRFYQVEVDTGLNNLLLQNINDTAGGTLAVGTQIKVDPNTIGITSAAATEAGGPTLGYFTYAIVLNIPGFPNNYSTYSTVRVTDSNGKIITYSFISKSGNNVALSRNTYSADTPRTINAGTTVNTGYNQGPAVVIGTIISSPVTIPNQGASVAALINPSYTGSDLQIALINGKQYYITNIPVAPGSTTIIVTNLTDDGKLPVGGKVLAGAKLYAVPEIPPCRMGAYGMGCNCVCLVDGTSFIIGDVVGAASGSPSQNYRDAVLKITQNLYLAGGGSFHLPNAGDVITAMVFPPVLDTSLGQGALQIGTTNAIFSNALPGTDPSIWESLRTPIQTEALKDKGPQGQNSTVLVNSDTFFRSDDGISSLVLARRDFTDWGNRVVSNEVRTYLDKDDQSLLPYGSAAVFDNRLLATIAPFVGSQGVAHSALVVLNFDFISTLRNQLPPAWEAVWTGINAMQLITGFVSGTKRAFAFTLNLNTQTTELYEILKEKNEESTQDDDTTPIEWAFETAVLFNKDIKPLFEVIRLRDGEIYLDQIEGKVHVKVFYKPDFYPCWTLWREFDVCEQSDGETSPQPGYRMRIGIGEPSSEDYEAANDRPLRVGNFFQFHFEITGYCVFMGAKFASVTEATPSFARIIE